MDLEKVRKAGIGLSLSSKFEDVLKPYIVGLTDLRTIVSSKPEVVKGECILISCLLSGAGNSDYRTKVFKRAVIGDQTDYQMQVEVDIYLDYEDGYENPKTREMEGLIPSAFFQSFLMEVFHESEMKNIQLLRSDFVQSEKLLADDFSQTKQHFVFQVQFNVSGQSLMG